MEVMKKEKKAKKARRKNDDIYIKFQNLHFKNYQIY